MRNLIKDIRDSVGIALEDSTFVHGRRADIVLKSITESTEDTYVYLEPPTFSGSTTDNTETASISIGFVTQDTPDSDSDKEMNESDEISMEEKIFNMRGKANEWLNYFNDNYDQYRVSDYNATPLYRAFNVCTGIILTLSISYNKGC